MTRTPTEPSSGFRVRRVADASAAAHVAADEIERLLREETAPCLGLATGRSMLPLYAELRARATQGLSFAPATTLNLDEYVGVDSGDPRSFRAWMGRELFEHVDLEAARTHVPRCVADPAAAAEAERFGSLARELGARHLQVLGIGRNGHVAFNEPGAARSSRCRVAELTPATRADAAQVFGGLAGVPKSAVTLGLADIFEARRIVLFAFGAAKAEALERAVQGPVSAACPASWLREHPDVLVLADEAASAGLTEVGAQSYSR